MTSGWDVERVRGRAADLHGLALPAPVRRTAWIMQVDRPALVLGSTQRSDVVDAGAALRAGVDVARRRSGGGAVLIEPDVSVWVDLVIPRDDPLWVDDVGLAFRWVGGAWAAALRDLGIDAEVHRGGLCTTAWSRLVCFGGLGSGEVTVAGRKAVGLSQRRGRDGARFQCFAHVAWDPELLVEILALDESDRAAALEALRPAVHEVPGSPEGVVIDALLARLP